MSTEKSEAEKKAAYDAFLAELPPHPTDGMTKEERDAYYAERQRERWVEAHEVEARVPGLDWGPEEPNTYPPYGGGCPWQAEGWLDGRPFYARYRGNTAAITIFDEPYDVHGSGSRPGEVESCVVYPYREPADEHTYDGSLHGVDEIVELFERCVPELAPTSEENPSHYMQLSAWVKAFSEAHAAAKASEEED